MWLIPRIVKTHVVVLNAGTRATCSVFDGYSRRLYLRSSPGAVYRRKASVPMPKVDLWPDDLGAVSVPNRAVVAALRAVTEWRHHGREDSGPVPVAAAHKVDAEGVLLRRWVADGAARHLP